MMERDDELSARIARLRREHSDVPLELEHLDRDPIVQFRLWLAEALEVHPGWPNAMTLATADASGQPSARIVLLKGVDEHGFTFFTNYSSPKARDLEVNPHAALVFYWPLLERQVRVRGPVVRLEAADSDGYFATRPRGSALGAWASPQSRPVSSRAELVDRMAELDRDFGDSVPRPEHWGGYRLTPVEIEFWHSRSDRLHDRFLYTRGKPGWARTRLAP